MPELDVLSAAVGLARPVFVDGMLRRGEERHINRLLPARDGVVEATLYNLGSCPGIVLRQGSLSGWVVGEVYRIT